MRTLTSITVRLSCILSKASVSKRESCKLAVADSESQIHPKLRVRHQRTVSCVGPPSQTACGVILCSCFTLLQQNLSRSRKPTTMPTSVRGHENAVENALHNDVSRQCRLCSIRSAGKVSRPTRHSAFSFPGTRRCRRAQVTSAVPTKTEDLKPGVETAEGLREAMQPIGPVTDLGYVLITQLHALLSFAFSAVGKSLAPVLLAGFQNISRSITRWVKKLVKVLGLQCTLLLNSAQARSKLPILAMC